MLEGVDDGPSIGLLISTLRTRKSEVSAIPASISHSTGESSMSRASHTHFARKDLLLHIQTVGGQVDIDAIHKKRKMSCSSEKKKPYKRNGKSNQPTNPTTKPTHKQPTNQLFNNKKQTTNINTSTRQHINKTHKTRNKTHNKQTINTQQTHNQHIF